MKYLLTFYLENLPNNGREVNARIVKQITIESEGPWVPPHDLIIECRPNLPWSFYTIETIQDRQISSKGDDR